MLGAQLKQLFVSGPEHELQLLEQGSHVLVEAALYLSLGHSCSHDDEYKNSPSLHERQLFDKGPVQDEHLL